MASSADHGVAWADCAGWGSGNTLFHVYRLLAQFVNHLEICVLPPYHPSGLRTRVHRQQPVPGSLRAFDSHLGVFHGIPVLLLLSMLLPDVQRRNDGTGGCMLRTCGS